MRRGSYVVLLTATAVFATLPLSASAASYSIGWYSINSGGAVNLSSPSYQAGISVGQAAAGYVEGISLRHFIGFWVKDDAKTPIVLNRIDDAKLLKDGELVSISGKVSNTGSTDRFSGFLYISESDRSSGIRVSVSTWPLPGLQRGSRLDVIGTMNTLPSGEREIVGSAAVLYTDAPLTPLGMPNRSVGGGDFGNPADGMGQYGVTAGAGVNNIGLLIKTWGRVVSVGSGFVVIDDGSGTPVRVDTAGLASSPSVDDYITVVGLSSLHKQGSERERLVLPRDGADIQ